MTIYGIPLTPLLNLLVSPHKLVALADDLTCTVNITKFRSWWTKILEIDPKFGYFSKQTKTVLPVKSNFEDNVEEILSNSCIKITSTGEKHLGVANYTKTNTLVIFFTHGKIN